MSIDLNWETFTTGPDGQELAHRIRDFIHSKFQTVPLPRFIKSVTVHDFEFGSIGPELELKDITDPLPDFYEENEELEDNEDDEDGEGERSDAYSDEYMSDEDDHDVAVYDYEPGQQQRRRRKHRRGGGGPPHPRSPHVRVHMERRGGGRHRHDLSGSSHRTITSGTTTATARMTQAAVPTATGGVPGGTSNLLHHFHSHLTPAGWSGTQTPLAAMAGAHLGRTGGDGGGGGYFHHDPTAQYHQPPYTSHSRNPSHSSSISIGDNSDYYRRESVLRRASQANPANPAAANLLHPALREKHSVSTLAPTSAGGASSVASRPPTRDREAAAPGGTTAEAAAAALLAGSAIADDDDDAGGEDMDRTLLLGQATGDGPSSGPPGGHGRPRPRFREPRAEDLQAVFRIRYAGDVRLLLTADILLDYPMPSFVGIPVRLSITGLTFDGVGVLAYIRRRLHFCFLSPEDALAAVGADDEGDGESGEQEDDREGLNRSARPATGYGGEESGGAAAKASSKPPRPQTKMGGLLQEVRVESEIGQREGGKQSLKNVGKVERFVLEQVRRIFEEEFVYPSFWTFLV